MASTLCLLSYNLQALPQPSLLPKFPLLVGIYDSGTKELSLLAVAEVVRVVLVWGGEEAID
ncbi:hypothetical protein HAX54_038774, partial [Datura stramonium]|nr:hypothetical protein [Datura stramonium]